MSKDEFKPLPGPVFLPTDPPPLDEPGFVPPRMVEQREPPPKPIVWRVGEPDFASGILEWFIPGLQEKWPNLYEPGLMAWLRDAMRSPHWLLLRSANCLALAQHVTDALDPEGYVQDRFFVRRKAKGVDDRFNLREELIPTYRAIQHWARDIRATSLRVSEAPADHAFLADRLKFTGKIEVNILVFRRAA